MEVNYRTTIGLTRVVYMYNGYTLLLCSSQVVKGQNQYVWCVTAVEG